jgi:creatinine amidohydrolase
MVQTREKSRRFRDLTYREIRECAQQGWLVVIPTGCTEQQGPHLPVDFDTWFAETLMVAAAEKTARSCCPGPDVACHAFGPTPEHRHFGSGYIDLPLALHHALAEAILNSLVA